MKCYIQVILLPLFLYFADDIHKLSCIEFIIIYCFIAPASAIKGIVWYSLTLCITVVIVDLLLSGTNFIDISASFLGGNAMPNSLYFLHNCWLMHF